MCPTEKVKQLTLFPEGTLDLASLLVLPGSDEARKMTATSGRNILGWFKKSDPVGLLARMLLGTSLWASTTCLLTWKVKDTPCGRLYFQLVPSTPHTDETGFSLWPTPKATEIEESVLNWKERKEKEGSKVGGPSLNVAVKMWPTPRASDGEHGGPNQRDSRGNYALPGAVHHSKLWPTPTTNDANNATLPPAAKDWDIIPGALMWEGYTKEDGQLNPEWVEALMNFPRGWTEV